MSERVAIIILNYNSWPDTVECLESLAKLDYPNFEVIVVDNASTTDASIFEKRRGELERAFKSFAFIQTGVNLGYAGGNNIGIKKALEQGSEWILVLNNDTIVTPDFLKKTLAHNFTEVEPPFYSFAQLVEVQPPPVRPVGILGPKILQPDGTLWSLGGRFNWNFFSVTRGILNQNYKLHSSVASLPRPQKNLQGFSATTHYKLVPTDFVSGTAMLVHRSVFETIGLLPEVYFLYYEDFEFCLRAREAGFFVGVAPEAVIYHKVSKSTQAGSPLYVYYHFRNSLLFTRRNIQPPLRWVIYLFSIWWVVKQFMKLLIPSRRANGWAGLRGMRDFWFSCLG